MSALESDLDTSVVQLENSATKVLAARRWTNNAALIADVARVYFNEDDVVLDPTYGSGLWWTKYKPKTLIKHDLFTLDGVDFRALPEEDESVDVVAYDPPYVCKGGLDTSTLGKRVERVAEEGTQTDFHRRYGLAEGIPRTPALLQKYMNEGLAEANRVSRRLVLARCKKYVSSGKLWNGTYETEKYAIETLGLVEIGCFQYIGSQPPEEKGRKQVHERQNYSTLYVFAKPKKRRSKS